MTRPDDGNWRMLSARERAYLEALEARCDRLELELGRICIEALQNHWEEVEAIARDAKLAFSDGRPRALLAPAPEGDHA